MEPTIATLSVQEEPDSFLPVVSYQAFLSAAVGLMPGAMVLANPLLPECTQALTLLSGQILECSLKAFLSKSGVKDDYLKKYFNHNLLKLWQRAATEGLPLCNEPPDRVVALNSLHDNPFRLRYPMNLHGLVLPNAQK